MVTTAMDMKKRYDTARAWVLATIALQEEEEHVATILVEEARAAAAPIEPYLPTPPSAPVGRVAPSDDDYEAIVIANIHVQDADMQKIHSLISVMLDMLVGSTVAGQLLQHHDYGPSYGHQLGDRL
jgi:hypothetical protein